MENKILCVIVLNRLYLFNSLFDFINNIEDKILIDSMDIIKLNTELQYKNNKTQIEVIIEGKKERMILKYVKLTSGWGTNILDDKDISLELE